MRIRVGETEGWEDYTVLDCEGGEFNMVVEADDEEGYIIQVEHEIIEGRAFPLLYHHEGNPVVKHLRVIPEGGIRLVKKS